MWIFWVIASGIFFILEIFTTGFLVFWLGIASIIAMIVSFFTTNVVVQTICFVVTSCILIIFTRPLINKFLKIDNSKTIPTNVYGLIGKQGIVIEDINPLSYTGKVKVSGQLWSAISDNNISKDSHIVVTKVDGVKLKVELIKETAEIIKK